jgi:hypothetical protein
MQKVRNKNSLCGNFTTTASRKTFRRGKRGEEKEVKKIKRRGERGQANRERGQRDKGGEDDLLGCNGEVA